ncbi:hypothetical protein D3C79_994980 [compost metagenome]
MLQHKQAFVFGAYAAQLRMQIDFLGSRISAFDPVGSATGHVVPTAPALIAHLAGAELFKVIRGGHAADVEEVFVLTDTLRPGLVTLAFGRNAIDGDLGLVHGDRPGDTDL